MDRLSSKCTCWPIAFSAAALSTSTLTIGSHSITAEYEGDSNYAPGTSNTVTQIVGTTLATPQQFSATSSGTTITLSWQAVASATGYEVYRATSIAGPFTSAFTVTATSTNDPDSLASDTTYLYEVRALGPGGPSGFSAIDAATTTTFTDGDLTNVPVKLAHRDQLRGAVSAMHVAAGLGALTFSADPPGGAPVSAAEIIALRTALNDARAAIGLSDAIYAEAITAGVTAIKRSHFLELRAGTQ